MDQAIPYLPADLDRTLFLRKARHNDPFFVEIHKQLSEYASEVFGQALKPSYVFLSMYADGGQCPLHIDRPQCYRTIDYLIRQSAPDPWPINIGPMMTDSEIEQIHAEGIGHPQDDDLSTVLSSTTWQTAMLKPNDAVLYSGTHQWHYRPTALQGSADLAFFHFVPQEYDGDLN